MELREDRPVDSFQRLSGMKVFAAIGKIQEKGEEAYPAKIKEESDVNTRETVRSKAKSFVDSGLISREADGKQNHTLYSLTDEGEKLFEKVRPLFRSNLLEGLNPDECFERFSIAVVYHEGMIEKENTHSDLMMRDRDIVFNKRSSGQPKRSEDKIKLGDVSKFKIEKGIEFAENNPELMDKVEISNSVVNVPEELKEKLELAEFRIS